MSKLSTVDCSVERSDAPEFRVLRILQCFRVTPREDKFELRTIDCIVERSDTPELSFALSSTGC